METTPIRRFEPGEIIAGKYQVERALGQGGMGLVLCAVHLQLSERVAIKILLQDAAERPEAKVRFIREARAAAKIKSEHVARVTDVANLESGQPYIVMEYLEGEDLARLLTTEGRLGVERAVELVAQTCEGIAAAHALGIVHRDLKPANLFLTHRPNGAPCVKILDFGISKLMGSVDGAADATLTRTAAMMGSPLYMSPEQIRAVRDVDARTDIWSLGVILFQLLTGNTPFKGATLPQISVRIATDAPQSLRSFRSDVPAELENIVLRCLEKDPDRRFQTAGELALALAPFSENPARHSGEHAFSGRSLPPSEHRGDGRVSSMAPSERTLDSAWDQSPPTEPRRRSRPMILGAFGAAAGAVLIGAWFLAQRGAEPDSPSGALLSGRRDLSLEAPLAAASVSFPTSSAAPAPPTSVGIAARASASPRVVAVSAPSAAVSASASGRRVSSAPQSSAAPKPTAPKSSPSGATGTREAPVAPSATPEDPWFSNRKW